MNRIVDETIGLQCFQNEKPNFELHHVSPNQLMVRLMIVQTTIN